MRNRVIVGWVSYHNPTSSLACLRRLHSRPPIHNNSRRWRLVRPVTNSSTATHPSALYARPRVAPATLSDPRHALSPQLLLLALPPPLHLPLPPLTMPSGSQWDRSGVHQPVLLSWSTPTVFYCFYLNFESSAFFTKTKLRVWDLYTLDLLF